MRSEGWEQRLVAYLADPAPFAWGERDCALWAAGWVARATGHNHAQQWRGHYHTQAGAYARMKQLGYATVADIAAAHLAEKSVMLAQRGDLVLHTDGALGICGGRMSHFLTVDGPVAVDTLACVRAWAV